MQDHGNFMITTLKYSKKRIFLFVLSTILLIYKKRAISLLEFAVKVLGFGRTRKTMSDNSDAVVRKEHGDFLYRQSKYHEAAVCYSYAINASDIKDTEFLVKCYSNRTAAYMADYRYELALKDIDECEKLDPNYIKGPYRRLQCLSKMGEMIHAREVITKREESPPIDVDQLWDKALVEYEEINSQLSQIKKLMSKEDYRSALYYAEQLYKKGFRGSACHLAQAECLAELERYSDAEQQVNFIFSKDQHTKNPDALYVRGKCLYFLRPDDLKAAHDVLKNALRCDPDHKKAQKLTKIVGTILDGKMQAENAAKKNLFREAFELYKSFFKMVEPNKKLYCKLLLQQSLAAFKAGMFYSCIDSCTTTLRHDPTNVQALKCRAESYESVQNWPNCLMDAEELLKRDHSAENYRYFWRIKTTIFQQEGKFSVSATELEAYRTLGLTHKATTKEIKNAYKKLTLRYHPDKNHDQSPEKLAENSKLFHKVSEAYKTLAARLNL